MKAYKGYELMKEIAEGKIKQYSEFKVMSGDIYIGIIYYEGKTLFWKNQEADEVKVCIITRCFFELIEEETIDIESIEKIVTRPYKGFVDTCNYLEEKGNEIIEAVKQLNRKLKELEEG